jgi:hypothetical protein
MEIEGLFNFRAALRIDYDRFLNRMRMNLQSSHALTQ